MKRFKCKVTRVDKYIIEFDEEKIDEEWMEAFRSYMYNFYDLEEHAEHIAQFRARFNQPYIEGYGVPLVDGEVPPFANTDQIRDGINIKIISEDDDIEVDVIELK
jgi:hypothetical protein